MNLNEFKDSFLKINKMETKLIAIIGPAGVGKTTIIEELKKEIERNYPQMTLNCLFEKAKYPFLDNQYKNKKQWAFITQIDFLTLRARELYSEYNSEDKKDFIITDRLYLDDYLYFNFFSQNKSINKKELKNYNFLFKKYHKMFSNEKIIFDCVFVLQADFEIILERIKKRKRSPAELNKNTDYWKKLYDLYFNDKTHLNFIKNKVRTLKIIDNNKEISKTVQTIIKELKLL